MEVGVKMKVNRVSNSTRAAKSQKKQSGGQISYLLFSMIGIWLVQHILFSTGQEIEI